MQNIIKFLEQLLYLIVLWKLIPIIFNLLFFHRLRITKHKILRHVIRCINKQIHLWLVKRERRLDQKIKAVQTQSNGQSSSKVILLSAREKR